MDYFKVTIKKKKSPFKVKQVCNCKAESDTTRKLKIIQVNDN